jgi:class 3 adenylate cyclase
MDVEAWLTDLGLGRYIAAFREAEIEAATLFDLNEDDLREIGLPLGPRKLVLKAIARLNETDAPPPSPSSVNLAFSPGPAPLPEAERRQLTVMFVDLVGSTAVSARLDPEDMGAVIRAYQNAVAGEIARVEGHVAKFMGDGVLAYFGWPRAHEDEAERAARAGLAIVAAVARLEIGGAPLACRVGVATGLVVVGDLIGEGAAREEAVVGDTPNLAARLQAAAQPGQVVIAEATRRLLGGAFDLTDLGRMALKGFAEPVAAFAVTGECAVESRYAARAAADPRAPLVGRDAELAVMRDCWVEACAGRGQLVLLTGEAGIGKSRIAQGLVDTVTDAHARIVWQCSPYHAETTLHPAIQHFSRAAGFTPTDDTPARRDRLDALMARDGVDAEAAATIAALLGLKAQPQATPSQARARTLAALIGWLETLARSGPVLWMLEDAHWIDPTTLELADLAIERIAQTRVLALVTARPSFRHDFGGHPIVTRLSLNRLRREAVEAIVARITGGKALPSALMEEIASRTDGVPLYVEEMTKAVLESGALRETETAWRVATPLARLAIPTSLQDTLMARLDRLQSMKKVAQTAAVIGRTFDLATLAAISPLPAPALAAAIERLVAAELVFPRDDTAGKWYRFKHALVRDAAYESLLRSRRQALHRRLVAVLEAGGAGPELLAQHAQAAGEPARAIGWWRAAGEAAAGRAAFGEAEAHLDAAQALLTTLAEPTRRREAAAVALARAHASLVGRGYSDPQTEALYAQADALAVDAHDARLLAQAQYGLWVGHHVREAVGSALGVARRMVDAATRGGEPDALSLAHRLLGTSQMMAGLLAEAKSSLELSLALSASARDGGQSSGALVDVVVATNTYLTLVELALGYPDRARSAGDTALEASRVVGRVHDLINTLWHVWVTAVLSRDRQRAQAMGAAFLTASRAHDLSFWQMGARAVDAVARMEADDPVGAAAQFAQMLDASAATGLGTYGVLMRATMADAMAAARDEDALAMAAEAEAHARRTGALYALAETQRRQGAALRLLRPDDLAGAETHFRRAIATARAQDARFWELRAACDLARLLAERGRGAEARALLIPIYGWFTEGFDAPDLIDAKALLDIST